MQQQQQQQQQSQSQPTTSTVATSTAQLENDATGAALPPQQQQQQPLLLVEEQQTHAQTILTYNPHATYIAGGCVPQANSTVIDSTQQQQQQQATTTAAHAAIYQANMLPAHIPSSMYVNNAPANLPCWPHTTACTPAGTTPHYIHGDIPSDQVLPLLTANRNTLNGSGGSGGGGGGSISGKPTRRGRGRGGHMNNRSFIRRSDCHSRGPLLELPVGLQPIISLPAGVATTAQA